MATIDSLHKRIAGAEDLYSVVRTMKTLAAVNVRHYERAAASLEAYHRGVDMGLQIALRDSPKSMTTAQEERDGRLGAVVIGSDQGMCGQFNERIAAYAVDVMNGMQVRRDERSVMVVGVRVAARLEDLHQPNEEIFSVPSSLEGLTSGVQELLLHIEGWRSTRAIDRIVLFYNRQRRGAAYAPQVAQLLPLDRVWLQQLEAEPWTPRGLPFYRMGWGALFAALIREHLFVSIYRAFAHSLASESASRLASMQAAERNIEKKLDEFRFQYQQQRQNAITSELLDIISGFEALAPSG